MNPRRWLLALVTIAVVSLVTVLASDDLATNEIQLQLADLLFTEGRYVEAAEAFDRAERVDDLRQKYLASTGMVKSLLRMAQFARAREEGAKLRASAPRDAEAIALYGDALWAAGMFDQAEQGYRDALALDPELPRGRHGLALTLMARNQLDAAMNEAQAALKKLPRDAELHHTVGMIYERMRSYQEAAVAYGNYLNLLPKQDHSEKAAVARAGVRFLRSFGRRMPLQVEDDGENVQHTIEFRLVNDKVVVRGSVNGGPPTDFVVDTGAEQTVILRKTAERMNVTPIVYTLSAGVGEIGFRGLQMARLDSLQIGSLKISGVPCLIKDPPLNDLPRGESESFSPLALGMSMSIDYGRRRLTIGRHLAPEPSGIELPLRLFRLAMVQGTINGGKSVNFVVDTGGEVISISSATASLLSPQSGRRIPLKVYGSSGWDRDAFLLPGVDLHFDRISLPNLPVVVLNLRAPSVLLGFELGGIVGHRFLSRYRVGIDLERGMLRLSESS